MKRTVAVPVLLLALGAIAAWWARSDHRDVALGIAARSESPIGPSTQTGAALATPDDPATRSADGSSAPAQRTEVANAARAVTEASRGAEVVVRVTSERGGAPLVGVGVYLDASSIPPATYDRFFLSSPLSTDAAGEVRMSVPSSVPLVIRCNASAHHDACAVDVEPVAAGDVRVVPIALHGGGDLVLHARVVDASTGMPVVGAAVEVNRSFWMARTETDSDGRIALRARTWPSDSVHIRHSGFAWGALVAGAGHETPEDALVVPLRPKASLSLRITGPAGARRGVRASVVADGSELTAVARGRGSESPWAGLAGWNAKPDDPDRSEWRDLPSGVPLWLELTCGRRMVRRAVEPLMLAPGEQREVEWVLGLVSSVNGRVLDQFGTPVVDCAVGLSAVPAEDQRLLDDAQGPNVFHGNVDPMVARTWTDAEGRFAFDAVEPGTWWVVTGVVRGPDDSGDVRFHRRWTDERERDSERSAVQIATTGQRVDVPEEPGTLEVTLRASRGLYISGRAVDPHGRGLTNVRVEAGALSAASCLVRVHFLSKDPADGSFLIGPLPPGSYSLTVVGGSFRSDPVIAEAGDEGVTIRCVFESRAPAVLHHASPF